MATEAQIEAAVDPVAAMARKVAEAAEAAFWATVADAYPDIETGDLDPATAARFMEACVTAVRAWLEANPPPVTITIFRDVEDESITVSDTGGEFDDAVFYDDGEQSSATVERDAEHDAHERADHYRQLGPVRIVRE